MSELIPVLETLLADTASGRPVALCAVVETRGSTPQSPGAAMLVRHDMSTVGTLGGGCVEAEVCKRAFRLLRENRCALLDFVLDHDYGWDDGLICGGRMSIAVQSVESGSNVHVYQQALDATRSRKPASFPVSVEREGKPLTYRVSLEVPPTLVIAGAGHVGQAVARMAIELDFHVVVIDDRADIASRERFGERVELVVADIAQALRDFPLDGGCYVVIVTRGHQHDHQALEAVIQRSSAYLGMIGSKRKSQMILRDLAEAGVPQDLIDRVHTPIGLPIGAVTVNEIAISVAAELVKMRRSSTPRMVVEVTDD